MKYLIIILLFSLLSCTNEPMARGVYFIDNKTTSNLKISASYNGEQIIFLDSLVETERVNHVYSVTEGSGGHVLPSNFFSSFEVFAITGSGDSLVYEGVRNDDWITSSNTIDQDITLVIE